MIRHAESGICCLDRACFRFCSFTSGPDFNTPGASSVTGPSSRLCKGCALAQRHGSPSTSVGLTSTLRCDRGFSFSYHRVSFCDPSVEYFLQWRQSRIGHVVVDANGLYELHDMQNKLNLLVARAEAAAGYVVKPPVRGKLLSECTISIESSARRCMHHQCCSLFSVISQ